MPSSPRLPRSIAAFLSALSLWLTPGAPARAGALSLPMAPAAWVAAPRTPWAGNDAPSLAFARYEGMPAGTLTLNEAIAVSSAAHFTDGTIEFDMKPLAYSDTGIIFHRQADGDGEFLYARANPDCPAADDCLQYAPIDHGRMDWDIYAGDQGPAPIAPTGWNHFRIVVAGAKMRVWVNHAAEPSLSVPRLQGLSRGDGIAFKGPAVFANLVLRSGGAEALADVRENPPAPGTIITWQVAAPVALPPHPEPAPPVQAADIPPQGAWRPFRAEPTGLVNLSRAFGAPAAPAPSLAWLKAEILVASPMQRRLALGWARQITFFLNGKEIYAASNPYRPQDRRLSPDGRMEPDNALLTLPLRQGRNDIVLAVSDIWRTAKGEDGLGDYGWAAQARIEDQAGITILP